MLAVDGDDVLVAWQDNRLGDNDIFFARSRHAGATFDAAERVDASGNDPGNQYCPAIAADPGTALYMAWEDERFGPTAIAVTRRALGDNGTAAPERDGGGRLDHVRRRRP